MDLVLGRVDAKVNDEYRLRYWEFKGKPLDQLPPAARQYPVDDVVNSHETILAQCGLMPKLSVHHNWGRTGACDDCGSTRFASQCLTRRPHRNLHDLSNQVGTAFALNLGATWGFRVDQSAVDIIERHAVKKKAAGISPFIEAGIVREDGTEDRSVLKKLVAVAYGATDTCPHCKGTGKKPSPAAKPVRCPDCKGRCVSWKAGGKVKNPTVSACSTCGTTGLVPNPNPAMITCTGDDGAKSCDGTGLVLTNDVPRSEKEGISFGRDALLESGSEQLIERGIYQEDEKVLKDYIPFLRTARCPMAGHSDDCPRKFKRGEACTCAAPYRDIPLTLNPNTLLETGRVSYSGYIQLLPRKPGFVEKGTDEYIPSLRECFVARPGHVLSSEDYRAGELVTHAASTRWLVGFSDLGKALLGGLDPHSALAATVLGIDYRDFNKKIKQHSDARQASKCFNFGKPGLMGDAKLVIQQRKQGPDTVASGGHVLVDDGLGNKVPGYRGLRFCILMDGATVCGTEKTTVLRRRGFDQKIPPTCTHCIECASRLGIAWKTQWRESAPYFDYVKRCVTGGMIINGESLERWPWLKEVYRPEQQLAPGEIMQHVSGRIRGGLEASACANGFFQGLLADAAKAALRQVVRECYDHTVRVPDMLESNSIRSEYAGIHSPLYGSRVIVMQHDEIIAEHREDIAHEAASRISEIMRDKLRWYCPDLADAVSVDPTLMRRWIKGAECVRNATGRLQVWESGQ